ncbi:hypothetical protein CLV92_101242 [Kineococcus xinjiangensis]|uniref:Cell division septum initiation protein DivIVA n=1 Tax=Kineococcus xinjiangensis TaxID=512762 RepID=A0A2S6IW93_9ACTN|nr:hypothetical protein [Kineococcus xinjiangensis]PPK98546.1 hypothetical protein CLV92_101242 [Kineococcus xinjiangensis]
MEVHEKLGQLAAVVTGARGIPMSTSCVVDREDVLRLVSDIRRLLPVEVQQAGDVLAARDDVLTAARAEAEHVVADARARADELVEQQAVMRAARERAEHIVASAREEAARLRSDADDWCDGKLADFESEVQRLLQQAARGRERLRSRRAEAGGDEAEAPAAEEPAARSGDGGS